ncbi:MAG: tetratricopeptide repeat protein, partial [Candidatus Brocadiae bacterium]|nr:tetratricopeptide repeat protein [Candidatus Brocadiia bacterium]
DAVPCVERFERFARADLAGVYLDDPAAFLTCHLAALSMAELAGADLNTQDRPALLFLDSRPEEFEPDRDIREVTQSLRLLEGRRESILTHLTNMNALDDPEAFRDRVRRMDEATGHILRSLLAGPQDPREGALALRRAAALAPSHPALVAIARRREALHSLSAEEIMQRGTDELRTLANRFLRTGNNEKALIALGELERREPDEPTVQASLGACYLTVGRPRKAIDHLLKAAQGDPASADVQFNLGTAYLDAKEVEAAIAHLERCLDLKPEAADTIAKLGAAHAIKGDGEEALRLFERAVVLAPDLPYARHSIAVFLLNEGRPAEAIPHLKRLVELQPGSPGAHYMLGKAYQMAGDEEAAKR